MNLLTLLGMVEAGLGDRVLLGTRTGGLTGATLGEQARRGARLVAGAGARSVVYVAENGVAFPLALFAAATAGVPFVPLNYRLAGQQLAEFVARQQDPFVVAEDPSLVTGTDAVQVVTPDRWRELLTTPARDVDAPLPAEPDAADEAVLLMTSGTTAAPKSAVLRHRHLVSYVLQSVDFAAADETEAVVVSVPPYHIAAIANLLSNLYCGRRIVYLDHFTGRGWLELTSSEQVTHAMLVPTMVARVVDELERGELPAPGSLRSLSYGGAAMPPSVLRRLLAALPEVGFVNAYGLTETSSSIAVLGPDDHREAGASDDPAVRARLGSVGRPLPGVEIEIRRPDDSAADVGEVGTIYVRGPQVAGEYRETGSVTDDRGWFCTRDEGYLDAGGFLFVRGRQDDTIIRGGENIAPAEIEEIVHQMPEVAQVAVTGLPDDEWGQRIAAFVVLVPGARLTAEDVRSFVRARLRSSKTPDVVRFLDDLPHTATGKILRRNLAPLAG